MAVAQLCELFTLKWLILCYVTLTSIIFLKRITGELTEIISIKSSAFPGKSSYTILGRMVAKIYNII